MIIPPHSGPIKTISVIVNNQNIGKVQKRIKRLEFLEAQNYLKLHNHNSFKQKFFIKIIKGEKWKEIIIN